MQITSYLLRYLLGAETLAQQAIKQSRAEQRERHFLSHLLLIVFRANKCSQWNYIVHNLECIWSQMEGKAARKGL